jgi:hypothetical protein
MVPSLLAFRETISTLLRGPLALPSTTEPGEQDEDKQLRDASSSAFQTGMGSRKNKPAEMIGASATKVTPQAGSRLAASVG